MATMRIDMELTGRRRPSMHRARETISRSLGEGLMSGKYHKLNHATALRGVLLPALGVASMMIAPERVNAQSNTTTAEESSANQAQVGEIVVTAERRASTVQRTPATIEV